MASPGMVAMVSEKAATAASSTAVNANPMG